MCIRDRRNNLLYTLSSNRPQTFESGIRIFEIGHVFSEKSKDDGGGLPNESENLCGLISGPRETESLWAQHKDWMDFYDLKGILEYCFSDISGQLNFEPTKKEGFEPGYTAAVNFNGAQIGWIGLTNDEVNKYFDLGEQEIFLNDKPVAGEQLLGLGDRIRFASDGEEISLIQVANG